MARRLVVEIVGDSKSLERAFARSSRSAKNFNRQMSGQMSGTLRATRSLTGALTGLGAGFIGLAGVGLLVREAFSEMAVAQKVTAQTTAALESTGGAAGVTAHEIELLGEELMRLSGVDDELIRSSQNLLLTFTQIRNEVGSDIFTQATKAALDMSTAMGTDLRSATLQVGKALQDPIRGITALRRAGVLFTAKQQKLIKSLVESGQIVKAQRLILRELTTEFGGSARAAGDTLPGKLAILKESLRNLGGTVAEDLAPKLSEMVDKFNEWLADPANQKQVIDDITGALQTLGEAAKVTAEAIKTLADAFGGLKGAIEDTNSFFERHKLGFLNKGLFEITEDIAMTVAPTARKAGEKVGSVYGEAFSAAARDAMIDDKILLRQLRADRERRPGRPDTTVADDGPPQENRRARLARLAGIRIAGVDAKLRRQLDRLQDLGLRKQLQGLRAIAQEVRGRLSVTKDATRRLTLEDQLLGIYREQRSVQEQITDQIKTANAALKERADAIKSAILERLQARQTAIDSKRELRDAKERLRVARQLGTALGIRTARENLQSVQAAGLQTRIENQPATLTAGGRLAVAGVVININGVTDPAAVARRVEAILKKRNRRTSPQSRGANA